MRVLRAAMEYEYISVPLNIVEILRLMQEIREIVINVYFTFLYLITYGIVGSTSVET
jgi:hypothetical protein